MPWAALITLMTTAVTGVIKIIDFLEDRQERREKQEKEDKRIRSKALGAVNEAIKKGDTARIRRIISAASD